MSIIYSLAKHLFNEGMDSLYKRTHGAKATQKAMEHPAIEAHLTDIGLEPQKFKNDGLEDYEKNKVKGHADFAEVKDHKGDTIGDRLKTADVTKVHNKLTESFAVSPELTAAMEEYKTSQQAFNELCRDIGTKYSAQDLIKSYKQYGSKAREAQSTQQKQEEVKLSKLFEDKDFVGSLKTSLAITSDDDLGTVKENMLAKLKEKHKKETEKLNSTIGGNEDVLHKAANKEQEMLVFLANQIKYGHETMRNKALEALQKKEAESQRNATMELGGDRAGASGSLEGITLDYFTELKTRTGRDIAREAGTYKISFSNRWADPGLYLDPRHSVRAEIKDIVDLVKAAGHDNIELKVNFSDPDVAKARAQDCARAALEAGFEPDKITIVVNGKPEKIKDLLEGSELGYFELEQKEAAKVYEPQTIAQGAETATTAMKERIKELKTTAADASPPGPETTAPSPG